MQVFNIIIGITLVAMFVFLFSEILGMKTDESKMLEKYGKNFDPYEANCPRGRCANWGYFMGAYFDHEEWDTRTESGNGCKYKTYCSRSKRLHPQPDRYEPKNIYK